MNRSIDLLSELIAIPSITPEDVGCQTVLIKRLQQLGFTITSLPAGPVSNFWALRSGKDGPVLAFAGHTDVVPAGPAEQWRYPPFTATVDQGYLFGRGAADMKGGLAAMVIACEQFITQYPEHHGCIGFIITSGEEGDDYQQGTPVIMQHLADTGQSIDGCIVGEPSSTHRVGDVIKIGRRGSLSASLTLHGKQGHVAYPHLADNPIHRAAPFLTEFVSIQWDKGNTFFPPTTLQISNIHAGTGAGNVIPGDLLIQFNLRYASASHYRDLQRSIEQLLQRHRLDYTLDWTLSGEPFLTEQGQLITAACDAITQVTGQQPELSTSGGTSDGRFIAPYGIPVIELGLCNGTIHQIDECTKVTDLVELTQIYRQMLERLLLK